MFGFRLRACGLAAAWIGLIPIGAASPLHAQAAHGGREVGLAEIEAYARTHAPDLRVMQARQRLGAGARAAASALFSENPALDLTAGPRWGGGDRLDYDFSAQVSQPVEIAGGRGARQRAAARFDERLTAEAELSAFELRIELALAYRMAQLARARLKAAESSLKFLADARRIAESRLAAGEATIIELRVAEGDLARAGRDVSLAQQSLVLATYQLCGLSGWSSTDLPLVAAKLPALRPLPDIDRLLAVAANRHPELRARRAALAQADAETDLAARSGWPMPEIGAELSRESVLDETSQWVLLGTVRMPLPLWQRNQAERERTRAEKGIAEAELDRSAHMLRMRIRRRSSELRAAAERLELLAASGAAFEDSLGLLRRGLEAGELAMLDVSVARERFLAAEIASLGARADYEQAWLELERATGEPLGGEL
jgi:cobalt-zinc-cadmium efflux system outer membrane protein